MKNKLLLLIVLFPTLFFAQVGIGTTSPNNSAALDIESTTKGLLTPRMTAAQRNAISSPANGLIVYQTDNTPSLYCFVNGVWTTISGISTSGNWTPVLEGGLSATTAGFYQRVGNIVSFSGTIDFNGGGFGNWYIESSIPIESNFTSAVDASGTVSGSYACPNSYMYNSILGGTIDVNDTTDKLRINVFNGIPQNPDNYMEANVKISFSGMYIIR